MANRLYPNNKFDKPNQSNGTMELARREFAIVAVTATLSSSIGVARQITPDNFSGIAVLEGPRSARPDPGDRFFDNKIAYKYRYIAEETKASWYITEDLNHWHPEPVGSADILDVDANATSLITRNGDLYVRRYA